MRTHKDRPDPATHLDEALARCIGDVGAFEREHWGQRPLLCRGAGPFGDLLDIAAVERLLGAAARRPTFRLVRDGRPVPPSEYTRTVRVGGTDLANVADIDRIVDQVADGATVVLQSLQRTWAPVEGFCLELEEAIGHPVQANAYLSPGEGRAGLSRHSDTHDVIVLQLEGAKGWDVECLGRFALQPGDTLYMPAGTPHAACAEDGYSLHLTIGILAVTRRDVLRRIVGELDDRPLPLGFTRPERRETVLDELAAAIDETRRKLGSVDVAAEADREIARTLRRRRSTATGRLRTLLVPDALDDDVVLARRHPLTVLPAGDGKIVAVFPDRRLRMPEMTGPALVMIASCDRIRMGDLPGLDGAERIVLTRRLVREGLLALVEARF